MKVTHVLSKNREINKQEGGISNGRKKVTQLMSQSKKISKVGSES